MKNALSILILATVFLIAISAMAADKVVVIPLNSSKPSTKLWGEGREGTSATVKTTVNGINIARSKGLASWDGAAAACPKSTWVCTLAEVENLSEDWPTSKVTTILCNGSTATTSRAAWVRDEFNNLSGKNASIADGGDVGIIGYYYFSAGGSNKCIYLPVWCCSSAN